MDKSTLETALIANCAPTLAGMKTASLFSFFFQSRKEVIKELKALNKTLNIRGVHVESLLWREKSVLLYVYRPKYLQEELQQSEIIELLEAYGYRDCEVKSCICQLKRRLSNYDCFPHEIGVFLGYPLEDVRGFIENKGKNCKTCGIWKVYCNEAEKQKLFQKFKKCTDVYIKTFHEGRHLLQMTVLS